MTVLSNTRLAAVVLVAALAVPAAHAQPLSMEASEQISSPSPRKAFAYSLLLPGLGHRHAHGGSWGRSGGFWALLDASVWTGVFVSGWQRDQRIESYRTLAVTGAGADIEGKNRTFFLRLAGFRSSDEFLEVSLRNRAWDQIDYVSDPSFTWEWTSEEDYRNYRTLRDEAESLRRRSNVLVASLVTNRLVSGLLAARAARRARPNEIRAGLYPVDGGRALSARLSLQF